MVTPVRIACGLALLLAGLPTAHSAPVVTGPLHLPPIVNRYDPNCLDRIDKRDPKLAARQSRECRKPRGARDMLPARGRAAAPELPPAPR